MQDKDVEIIQVLINVILLIKCKKRIVNKISIDELTFVTLEEDYIN